jgi:flavodoxin
MGKYFDVLPLPMTNNQINIEEYSHAFVGTPTNGDGITPKPVLDFLRYILKENNFKLPSFSVFGTGDTQWAKYCKAVDELEFHLSKKTQVISNLKIEQYPISDYQINKINNFVEMSLRGK